MTRRSTILLLALIALSGCGGHSTTGALSLGRPFATEPSRVGRAPAPSGDPPAERGGTLPASQRAIQENPTPGSAATSPQAALHRYALAYTNWQATNLPAQERLLAFLAVGPARLAAQQIAASQSATAGLLANHVRNRGAVLAITVGQSTARGRWVVVTQEQTTGTGPYAGLPSTVHVTFAKATQLRLGWVVSEWNPLN